jgi:hypothetical protein
VGDDLDPLAGTPPILGDIGCPGPPLVRKRLVLEGIEVKRHQAKCRVPGERGFGDFEPLEEER